MTDFVAPTNSILLGVVGSKAYGLDHEGSDTDYLGIFAHNTEQLFDFSPPVETLTGKDPDYTFHEAAKFCRLAFQANPTVNELLWLHSYEHITLLGSHLLDIRQAFLSEKAVMNAYVGYADQQFKKLKSRADGKFDSDTANRTLKHAMHLIRLLEQGEQLYTTGELEVHVKHPDTLRELAQDFVENPIEASIEIAETKALMLKAGSPLPSKPDADTARKWLRRVRHAYYIA